ncbi:putative diguanylate cyclase YdaM [mine drainage metagenome]|uniref:Putative diguanylate cyclase YdaM n=1 Tax=mine drainage metagenome TaxID=410659 RepID=A0A1J5TNH4_9ZZZZ
MLTDNSNIQYRFSDLIDVPAFARMLENFFQATGIPNGVVDVDGNLLSMSCGNNACATFHRVNPEATERCRDSNIAIMHDLRNGHVAGGLCRNGLMDYATPVVIEGQQLATLFLGQILHTPPDMEFFRAQATQFGFDEKTYLKSIQAIPVIEKAQVESLMTVMVDMAKMLANCGLIRLRQTALEHDLNEHAERRIQLEDILNLSPVAIGWSNGENRIEYVNLQFTLLFGYNLDDLPDLETWYRLAYPDENYREMVIRPWMKNVATAKTSRTQPPELEVNITCKDGTTRRIVIRASWIGQRRLVNFTDITDRWISEQRKQAHDTMLEMVAKGAELADILNAIVRQAQSEDKTTLCSILLIDEEGKHLLSGAAPDLQTFYTEAINGLEIGMGVGSCGTAAFLGQRVIVEDIQTHEYWKPYTQLAQKAGLRACWSEPIRSSRGKILGTFAIYHTQPKSPELEDIERIGAAANLASIAIENRYAYEELERRAYSDYLTGLANRRFFLEQAESELSRALRYDGELSILMLDIDNFKLVNDTHGHKIGDLVLKKLSDICRNTLRDVDIIGRIGGEEFAVLLPETGSTQAEEVAERLRAAIDSTRVSLDSGLPLHFTISLGVTTLFDKDINIDTLLNQADQALYQAKNSGRNRVCSYHVTNSSSD